MSFAQKLMSSLFIKEDSVRKQLKQIHLYTDSLSQPIIAKGLQIFYRYRCQSHQEQFVKSIMKLMNEKTTYARKLKLLFYVTQITKITKYDIGEILINKKLKLFTKANIKVKLLPILDKNSLEDYIYIELIMPLYNYLMKLSVNEELYNTCKTNIIPNDEVFRRGTKIRFIWIFKIYNIIHIVISILETLIKFLKQFPLLVFFREMAVQLYFDLLIMNNFIIKALGETVNDNYLLMPYFDMLQFYQSLIQQNKTNKKIFAIYEYLFKLDDSIKKPNQLNLTHQEIQEIQVQALRVKLISNTLKNPKKDHTRLQTQYNVKSLIRQKFHESQRSNTEGNQQKAQRNEDVSDWKQKFRNLDIKPKHSFSLEEVSDENSQDENQVQKSN